jgi:hypothetical protein
MSKPTEAPREQGDPTHEQLDARHEAVDRVYGEHDATCKSTAAAVMPMECTNDIARRAFDAGVAWERSRAEAREAALVAERDRVRNALNRDQTGLARALDELRDAVAGWAWLGTPDEWGGYAYEDHTIETVRKEAATLITHVIAACNEALAASGEIANRVLRDGDTLPVDPHPEVIVSVDTRRGPTSPRASQASASGSSSYGERWSGRRGSTATACETSRAHSGTDAPHRTTARRRWRSTSRKSSPRSPTSAPASPPPRLPERRQSGTCTRRGVSWKVCSGG